MRLRRTAASLSAALLIAGGVVAGSADIASAAPTRAAATCTNSGCDGLDPVATGCNQGATEVMSQTAWGGTANLWWSAQPCNSNWVQYDVPNSSYQYDIEVIGSSGYQDDFYTSTPGWAWGNLAYSPGAATMCIGRRALSGGTWQWNCWTQSS